MKKQKKNQNKKPVLFLRRVFMHSLTHRLFFALSLSLCCGLFYSCALSASVSGFSLLPALFALLLTSLSLGRCANIKGKVFGGSSGPGGPGGPSPDGPGNFSNLDAFVVNLSEASYFYANNGSGEFTASAIEADTDAAAGRGAALGDLDGDGDLDVFVANDGAANRIYINEGAGVFTASAIIVDDMGTEDTATNSSYEVALGDLDSDGDLDAFVVNLGQSNRIYTNRVNEGLGWVVSDVGPSDKKSQGVALGDLDGDGDLDAFVVNNKQINRIYTNTSSGHNNISFTSEDTPEGSNYRYSARVALGDLDGDGDLDAFVLNSYHDSFGTNRIYTNTSPGRADTISFTADDVYDAEGNADGATNYSTGVALGDLDGDGDLDAFVTNSQDSYDPDGIKNRIYTNTSPGRADTISFTAEAIDTSEQTPPLPDRDSYGVALGDLDGDGDLDAFVVNDGEANRIYTNDDGVFTAKDTTGPAKTSRGVVLGDFRADRR